MAETVPPQPSDIWDVAIVGAGLSGLSAARELTRAGKRCVILEARDRVGGKTFSTSPPFTNAKIDLGAAWINGSNQSRMFELAQQLGAELITQNTAGNVVLQDVDGSLRVFPYGGVPPFDEESQRQVVLIRDQTEADCQTLPLSPSALSTQQEKAWDSVSFEQYCRAHTDNPAALRTANLWVRAMLGHEAGDVSALYFLRYCRAGGGLMRMRSDQEHGGQYLRIRKGTQSFADGLAASLPASRAEIVLRCPVSAVHATSSGDPLYHINSPAADRVFLARRVVMAVPAPRLRHITFSPALPPAKTAVQNAFRYGYYTKVMLAFRTPFWTRRGFCGLVNSFAGPAAIVRDSSIPADGAWVLTCFPCGDAGRAWAALPGGGEVRERALLEQVGEVFGDADAARREFLGSVGHDWNEDEFAGWGCPCAALPPGVMAAAGTVVEDPAGGVYFAGTETADEWKGYMEGAVRSGMRAAREVLADADALP